MLTRELARFVCRARPDALPDGAYETARRGMLDAMACALAGSRTPCAMIVGKTLDSIGPGARSSLIGRDVKASPAAAAFFNGTAAHALGYDDVARPIKGHPSVVLLPVVLALGESRHRSGIDVLAAYIIGFEVACRVGSAMSDAFFDRLGWHPTAPLGALGAAASASYLLGLDEHHTAMALSLAASQASGLRHNFGTMTKAVHAGLAARAGVTAAILVEGGLTASTDGIEGGFVNAFSGGAGFSFDRALDRMGEHFYAVDPGIEFKKYPCCNSAHLAIDALFALLATHPIEARAVERIDVMVDFDPPRSLFYERPETGSEAKFSMQYCVAASILDGELGLASFEDEQVVRPAARELASRVHLLRNPGYDGKPSWVEGSNRVSIRLANGDAREQLLHRPPGAFNRAMTIEHLRAKARQCATPLLGSGRVDTLLATMDTLETLPDVAELSALVRCREPAI